MRSNPIITQAVSMAAISGQPVQLPGGAGGGEQPVDPRLSGTILREATGGGTGLPDSRSVQPVVEGLLTPKVNITVNPATNNDKFGVARTKFFYDLRVDDAVFDVWEYDFDLQTVALVDTLATSGLGSNPFVRGGVSHDGKYVYYMRNANAGDRVAIFELDPSSGNIVRQLPEPPLPASRQIAGFSMNADGSGAIFTYDQAPYYGGLSWNETSWGTKTVTSTGGLFGQRADCSSVDPNLGVVTLADRLTWVDPASAGVTIIENQSPVDRAANGARFSPDGNWLAIISSGNTDYITIYDTTTRAVAGEIVTPVAFPAVELYWITNEQLVVAIQGISYRYAWNGTTLTLEQTL